LHLTCHLYVTITRHDKLLRCDTTCMLQQVDTAPAGEQLWIFHLRCLNIVNRASEQ